MDFAGHLNAIFFEQFSTKISTKTQTDMGKNKCKLIEEKKLIRLQIISNHRFPFNVVSIFLHIVYLDDSHNSQGGSLSGEGECTKF